MRHGLKEGVGRAAVFEVAYHVDCKSFERALSLEDRIKVEESLRRVLVCTISCVYNRNICNFGSIAGTALKRMAHHNHIHVVVDHLDCVLQGLALALAGV